MEPTTEERIQQLFGQFLALSECMAALLKAHPNKDVLETTLLQTREITLDVLARASTAHPDRAHTMIEEYLAQSDSLRSALRM